VLVACHLPKLVAESLTQVRFSLSSSLVFSRSDTVTDLEQFYNSIVELFKDPEEQEEVNALVTWWNWQVKLLIYFYHH